jgi:hypothetical protein
MTLGEVLVASAITVTLMGTVVGMTGPLQRLFDTQPEIGDMHQRLRGVIDAMTRDLVGAAPPVMPYRTGIRGHDPGLGVFYRSDAITVVPATWDPGATSHTYYVTNDAATGVAHLMRYDGGESDLPLADHITHLEFAYFDEGGVRLEPALFQDGPWFPDERDRNRFDMDLLRIRRVRVTVRVEAASALRPFLPDREVSFDVAPRNLNRE